MDRLSEDLKRTMQVASVIGRDFAYRILKSIMELGEELRTHLSNLVGLEILYEKALYPELEYIFKHALTQEVAYESLLKQRRRKIHERVAGTIEELYAGSLEEHYELLAHHYELSGNPEKTVEYLLLAGEKSHIQLAAQTTCEFFEKALHIADREHIELEPEVEANAYRAMSFARHDMGDIQQAMNEAGKAATIYRRHGIVEGELENLGVQAALTWFLSPPEDEASRFFEKCIARARETGERTKEGWIQSSQGFYLCSKGKIHQGYEMVVGGHSMTAQSGDTISEVFSLLWRISAERWVGYPAKAIELSEGVVDVLRQAFNVVAASGGIFLRGTALAEIGRIEEGIRLIREGIDSCEKIGGGNFYLGRLYNCLGYCYSELLHPELAHALNLESEKIAREQMKKYPGSRKAAAEVAAQASVNQMENLFDQGKPDEAWERIILLEQDAKGEDFDDFRILWEMRIRYLAARILLERNEVAQAETIIQTNLERSSREHLKKNEGRFLRLLGEVQTRRNESANAITTLNEAIRILGEVGNHRQLWQAHASLAAAFDTFGRAGEARDQWSAAGKVILNTANGLSDQDLREGFLSARPVKEILTKAEA
jgi:tetratricopeptide (TPR) repeat protein